MATYIFPDNLPNSHWHRINPNSKRHARRKHRVRTFLDTSVNHRKGLAVLPFVPTFAEGGANVIVETVGAGVNCNPAHSAPT